MNKLVQQEKEIQKKVQNLIMTNMRDKKIPVGWSPLVISSNFIHFLWEVRAPTQP